MNYCNYCPGYCCYRLEGSVLLIDADDINRLARYMENRHTFKVKSDGACIFQAGDRMVRRCTVHAVRPGQCRRFPYDRPCPYLENDYLLAKIQPRLETGLKEHWLNKSLP